jgi:hypothetical protein
MSGDPRHQDQRHPDTVVVQTNLDLIKQLENPESFVVAVILAGRFAADRELASFLVESYPGLEVIDGDRDPEAALRPPTYG